MGNINTDALAEMHYASSDPAYETEEDLEEQKERMQERAETLFENAVKDVLNVLSEEELHALALNRDSIADWVADVLEEYE